MSDNLDKLKGHSDVKQDINRRKPNGDVNGKEAGRLNKRINDISKVISDPDVWNVNIASRDRMDDIEGRLRDVEHRLAGIAYLVRRLVMNKRIQEDQLQVLEDETPISGSSE